jgi:superoxide dismutase, Cu-Zn family
MHDYRPPIGIFTGLVLVVGFAAPALAARPPTFDAPIFNLAGKQVGDARFVGQDGGGTQIVIHVSGLPPGIHGFHVHENGSCNATTDAQGNTVPFGGAGAHFDPAHTGHHLGPAGGGHAGDLPVLTVDAAGNGGLSYYAANLQTSGPDSIVGRALIIHANPDNYTDTPPLGGSGARIACGQIGAMR